jgi:N-acylneuraminate cytidylyltransferase
MISGKKILAVIPARANSSFYGKNFRELYGRPLFYWSLDASCQSKYVDLTVVSSNDQLIQGRTYSYMHSNIRENIKFIWRPENISTDVSPSEDALIHACKEVEKQYHERKKYSEKDIIPDIIIMLQPTSPIRTNFLLDKCIEKFFENQSDSLFTACRQTPFYWKLVNGKPVALYDYQNRPMRQSLKEEDWVWHDDGNIYVTNKRILFKNKCRLGGKVSIFETDEFQTLQIDTLEDFQLIEAVCGIIGYPLKVDGE